MTAVAYRVAIPVPGKGGGDGRFSCPSFRLFRKVRGRSRVFRLFGGLSGSDIPKCQFVNSDLVWLDYPCLCQGPVENTRFSRRFAQAECMPFACFFRYCDGYKCVSCAKWKVEREFFGYPGLQNDSTVWYAVSFRLDEKAAFYAVHRLVGSGVFRRQAHAVASA